MVTWLFRNSVEDHLYGIVCRQGYFEQRKYTLKVLSQLYKMDYKNVPKMVIWFFRPIEFDFFLYMKDHS